MAFKDITPIETADFYLDVAFRAANKKAGTLKTKKFDSRVIAKKTIEITKLDTASSVLTKHLKAILANFPSFDDLPEFYNELIRCTLDYDELKRSLGAVKWTINNIDKFRRMYVEKIKICDDYTKMGDYKNEYFGRISSVVKQVKKNLVFLENARKAMVRYPAIKQGCFTVAIAGFPNVGKTTLLSKLTNSKPEINEYAFTTKSLNLGYSTITHIKIQFIDTPGTLNRFDRMNIIEQQAYLAIKHAAHALIYVFDLTEPYPLEDQIKLLKKLKAFKKQILLYASKTDILSKEAVAGFAEKYDILTVEKLQEKIQNMISENNQLYI